MRAAASRCSAQDHGSTGWRAVAYAFVLCLSGIPGLAAAMVWAGGLTAFLYPVWRRLWPLQAGSLGELTSPADIAAISAAGLVIAIAGAWPVRALARLDGVLVRGLLGPSSTDLARRIQAHHPLRRDQRCLGP